MSLSALSSDSVVDVADDDEKRLRRSLRVSSFGRYKLLQRKTARQ